VKARSDFNCHDETIGKIFGQSYGGNRNFILAYTLGKNFISVDDDMSPFGLFDNQEREGKLQDGLISSGCFLYESEIRGIKPLPQDIIGGYLKFLGTRVGDHYGRIPIGVDVSDPNVDALGMTAGDLEERVMTLVPGDVSPDARIRIVQTHLTGDADIDSADLVNLFIETGVEEILSGHLPKKFVLQEGREVVTAANNRLTGAVLGYDNSEGAIYFLPTNFRCEDFIWREYLSKRSGIASAYTEHAQTHNRSLSVRASVAREWFNELIAQRVKRRIKDFIEDVGENFMTFGEPYGVGMETATDIHAKITERRDQALEKHSSNGNDPHYMAFADELGVILSEDIVSAEQFSRRLTTVVREELNLFNKTAALWPKILECSYDMSASLPIENIVQETVTV